MPIFEEYGAFNNPKYLDRQTLANSVDPDQMLQNAPSDQGLHCLPHIQQFLYACLKNGTYYVMSLCKLFVIG